MSIFFRKILLTILNSIGIAVVLGSFIFTLLWFNVAGIEFTFLDHLFTVRDFSISSTSYISFFKEIYDYVNPMLKKIIGVISFVIGMIATLFKYNIKYKYLYFIGIFLLVVQYLYFIYTIHYLMSVVLLVTLLGYTIGFGILSLSKKL